ncbi:MAG: hypothetical protein R2805_12435 [Flavobacterium sp.]|uniref:hypothetical protein n=1 Tax=Flavobacterium sp. TaxID=239 RepID=UPI00352807EF
MPFDTKFWIKFSLINLSIVALLGLVMRYKIGFEFSLFNQKNIQHSHSHFAFSGWITHTLMVVMISYLTTKVLINSKKYILLLILNLVCSYGMLFSFFISGYTAISIIFSTASIFVSYVFAVYFYNDLKRIDSDDLSKNWFKAAVFFSVISSFGTFFLAYMMMTKNIHQEEYLASIYYYLHFQYNGWFFFACMGLLFSFLNLTSALNPFLKQASKLFFVSCIPAYFLSTLWLNLPNWIYFLTIIAAFIQVYAWFRVLVIILKTKLEFIKNQAIFLRYILGFIGLAASIKFLLQLGSTIPALSQLAFGFRPIVIAYLHLVLLAIISLFLLFYIYAKHTFYMHKKLKFGIILFTIGIFLNELALAIQGIASFSYTLIPFINEILFGIAILLFLGIIITSYFSIKKVKINANL